MNNINNFTGLNDPENNRQLDWRNNSYRRNTSNYNPSHARWNEKESPRHDRSQWNDYENWRDEERKYAMGDTTRNFGNKLSKLKSNAEQWLNHANSQIAGWLENERFESRRTSGIWNEDYRGKGPKGYRRTDEKIFEAICDRLYSDRHVDASGIDVKVKNGHVHLSGRVFDSNTKHRAEYITKYVLGVNDVSNNLKIDLIED